MKNYKFLIKPLLFIFNLLFATWLVYSIEQVSPSHFGMKDPRENQDKVLDSITWQFRQLCLDHKEGRIDSVELEKKLRELMKSMRSK